MDVAYAVHTESQVLFLLDARGICRGVTSPSRDASVLARVRHAADTCIGAQYVASVDVTAPGGLVHAPRPGAHLVFAVVAPDRHVSLVRTARAVTSATGEAARTAAVAYAPMPRPEIEDEDAIPSLTSLFDTDGEDDVVTLRFATFLPAPERAHAAADIPPPPRVPHFDIEVPVTAAPPPESHIVQTTGNARPTRPWGEQAYALSRRSSAKPSTPTMAASEVETPASARPARRRAGTRRAATKVEKSEKVQKVEAPKAAAGARTRRR